MGGTNEPKKYDAPEDKLIYACFKGCFLVVQELLDSGVSPNCQGILRTTPLHAATTHGHFEIIDLLLEHGADINFESGEVLSFSRTPLAIACYQGDTEMAEYLIARGAGIDLMSGLYGNPVHAAIQANNLILLKFLLNIGASIEAKHGVHLDTPICYAARLGHREAVEILVTHGAKTKPLRKMPRHHIPTTMVKFLKNKKHL
ncbi:MAG: ankyrin repeat domain-containing protein [Flavobacteriaceae bacterium]|nr:ankyrin repeat domain-containing protein [Flavobacteriaceae bacterium]